MKKFLSIIFLAITLGTLCPVATTQAIELIPCATIAHPEACTLCHLIVGFHNVSTFLLKILIVISLAGIFFAGVIHIISAGSESLLTTAKNFLKASLTGFVVVLGAWLLVNVIMWVLSAKTDLGIGATSWNVFECGVNHTPTPDPTPIPPSPDECPIDPIVETADAKQIVVAEQKATEKKCGFVKVVPKELIFENVVALTESAPQTVTVQNKTNRDVPVSDVQIADEDKKDSFIVKQDYCKGKTLNVNQSCTVEVAYNPKDILDHKGSLKVTTSEGDFSVPLSSHTKRCELIAGKEGAKNMIVLMRSEIGTYNNDKIDMTGEKCPDLKEWDAESMTDLDFFKKLAGEMAGGLNNISPSEDKFSVYRLDLIFDGSSIDSIIEKECLDGKKNDAISSSVGFVFNGGIDHIKSSAYSINNKAAFYCENGDIYKDRVFAHEQLGHIFGQLDDEYKTKTCYQSPFYNITMKDNKCEKWKDLVNIVGTDVGDNHCFQGCNCESLYAGCYRSTEDSIMNNHANADFSSLQKYILSKCINEYNLCPPSPLKE